MNRIDQITFGGEDASWLTNLNSDFINMVSPSNDRQNLLM